MTTGSWSVGTNSQGSAFYAAKNWNGANGKYEAWAGGTRSKWNTYTMTHTKWLQSRPPGAPGHGAEPPKFTANECLQHVDWGNNDDLRLLNKLAEKIKGHAFDLGINMAEAKRSYGLVLSNLQSVGSGLVNLKRGNVAAAFGSLGVPGRRRKPLRAKDVSGRWLEMQYGWRPLVDQAYEAGKALEAVTKQRTMRFTASSTRTISYNASAAPSAYSLTCSVAVNKRILADLYENISFARSLGLTNPAAIAWEVVPYSFVVDWFLPVGSYLAAWGVIPALRGRFLQTTKGTVKGAKFIKQPGAPAVWVNTNLRFQHVAISRSVSTSLSVPRPSFNSLPRALSPSRLYNAVALVHQRLR